MYQFNPVPVAVNPATVPELQKDCAEAVGAAVVFTVKKTAVEFELPLIEVKTALY